MRLFLSGVRQTEIAGMVNASQSTISAVISRFKRDASKASRNGASSARAVLAEVKELRSLSVEQH